jgi:xanthine dehydrogenase accessory factor
METFTWIAERLAETTPVALARITAVSGFGGKRSGEVMGITAEGSAGHLAMGAADTSTVLAARELLVGGSKATSIVVPVGDSEATTAGLACGGSATILIQRADGLPDLFWLSVTAGRSVVLASGPRSAMTATVADTDGSIEAAHDEAIQTAARQMLAKGPIERTLIIGDDEVYLQLIAPQPRLLVLGEAELSRALVRQGNLLGWTVEVCSDLGAAVDEAVGLAGSFGPLDGVVVLSHDLAASCSVLAAALMGNCGYVGALGSRHTQAARGERLAEVHRLDEDTRSRVHGPVGLKLGSRTPEETALAIAAEMIGARS